MLSKKLLAAFLLVVVCSMLAAEPQTIIIKSSKFEGLIRTFEVDIPGRSTELFCFVSIESCNDLTPGKYLMLPSPTGKYQDCDDVDIYPYGADTAKSKPLGTYGLQWP